MRNFKAKQAFISFAENVQCINSSALQLCMLSEVDVSISRKFRAGLQTVQNKRIPYFLQLNEWLSLAENQR